MEAPFLNLIFQFLDGRDPFEAYRNLGKKDWHDYAAMKADAAREGPGEGGKPLAVSKDDEKLAKLRVCFRD
jgi:hypothetical protein